MQAALVSQKPKKFDLTGFLRLIRVNNLLIIAFTQYMVKLYLVDNQLNILTNLQNYKLHLLVLATVLIAAAGYIINDYYDVKIDTINKPGEVVVGRIIKRRVAMFANFVFNFFGLLAAWALSYRVFALCFFCGFLLWFYSNRLKRIALVGNITVALLTALSVVILAVQFPNNQLLVYLFAFFAFFISIIREIVKDMEDVKGDADFGCKTLPIIWGMRRTKQVIYVFFAIFTTILLSTLISFPNWFAVYLYLVVLPPSIWFYIRLQKADTKKDFKNLSNLCKIIMLLGVLSVILI
jgi:4-hydroxybenzoate polyprenyltransferase